MGGFIKIIEFQQLANWKVQCVYSTGHKFCLKFIGLALFAHALLVETATLPHTPQTLMQ